MRDVKLAELLIESVIPSLNPNADKRLRVKLNCGGVEKRPLLNESGTTKYYTRKANQFVYGRQNLFKGAFGIVPQELDGYESSTDLPAFDVSDACIPEWITYFLQAGERYKHLETLSKGSGSKRIHPNDFLELAIPLPPVEEQKEILEKIHKTEATYNKTTNELQTQSDLIAKLRASILMDAVSGRLVPQEPNDEPAIILLDKIRAEKERLIKEGKIKREKSLSLIAVDEIPYELPEGWVWVTLLDLFAVIGGATPNKSISAYWNGNIPWVSPKDMKIEYLSDAQDHVTELAFIETRLPVIPENSLLIVVRGMILLHSFPIALTSVPVAINQDMKALSPFLNEVIPYLMVALKGHKKLLLDLVAHSTHGTCKLESHKLFAFKFGLPPLAEQHRIVAKVEQLMATCDALEAEVAKSRTETDRLMQTILKEAFNAF